ncbi:flagellar protein FlgN [Nocardioides sp. NPDC087217]|uniref:flagellar protein FlgN n=1 Tax=Nocardioides sp. NPDC087217 TaxID=3364335 RepID=UPI0037FF2089
MPDVSIKIETLDQTVKKLDSIIDEFDHAVGNADALEGAIGNPFRRGELRGQADDFEQRWDMKRNDLKDELSDVRDHIKGVVEGFQNWDSETALLFQQK